MYELSHQPPRILITGLPGAGKKTLFNTLSANEIVLGSNSTSASSENFDLFQLADLSTNPVDERIDPSLTPVAWQSAAIMDEDYPIGTLVAFARANLIVYVINSTWGMTPADFQWIDRLRVGYVPLLVVLNQVGEERDGATRQAIETELAWHVLAIDARDPADVRSRFVAALIQTVPQLTVPLTVTFGTSNRQADAPNITV